MQSFDENLLADPSFAMHQDWNVFFQQPLCLAYGFVDARVAEVERCQGEVVACGTGRWLLGGTKVAGLNWRRLLRAFDLRVKAKAPAGAQVEWQRLRLVEQLLQRYVEQAFDIHLGQADAEQAVGTAIGGYHLTLLIENQQSGPGAAEVIQAGVETQLKVALLEQVENQAVLHRLAHHLDHAQGVRGRQVAVARHIQHRNHLPLLVKNRRGRAGHKAVGLEEMLIVLNMYGLGATQGGADGIGAGVTLQPGGSGDKTSGAARLDKALITPGLQHLSLVIGQHDQAIGVGQDGAVVGQHFLVGGVHQGVLAFK